MAIQDPQNGYQVLNHAGSPGDSHAPSCPHAVCPHCGAPKAPHAPYAPVYPWYPVYPWIQPYGPYWYQSNDNTYRPYSDGTITVTC